MSTMGFPAYDGLLHQTCVHTSWKGWAATGWSSLFLEYGEEPAMA
jgi:hypothetical protein